MNTSYTLQQRDVISHTFLRIERAIPNAPIVTIIETPQIHVVDKPSGIPVHPNVHYNYNTVGMIIGLKHCVNRIDKPTSGIVVFAKTSGMCRKLKQMLDNGAVKKRYIAKVFGDFSEGLADVQFDSDGWLDCRSDIVVGAKITTAQTRFRHIKCIKCSEEIYSILEAVPKTGRTHQIRKHLKSLGFPIVNDLAYGRKLPAELRGSEDVDIIDEDMEPVMYLHSYQYTFDDAIYTASVPSWAECTAKELG